MPRAKVDPRFRRRVAHACDSCKRRKAKCNGVLPCEQCESRGVPGACRYTRDLPPTSRSQKCDSLANQRHDPTEREIQLELAEDQSAHGSSVSVTSLPSEKQLSIPSSKDSQMLRDSKGKFIYAGESASLSFLETVRSAVQFSVGPCAFTNEPHRNPMVESTPKIRFQTAEEPVIDIATAKSLTSQFFLAVSGILDLFDPPWLSDRLESWFLQHSQSSKSLSAIIYLALAIGAQGKSQGDSDDLLAEQCFAYGRQIIMFDLIEDPSLATIQAVLLSTYYMMAACQYNSAFIHLGLAVRTAYTLGIHLHETNRAFGGEEGLSRERSWKSLRVCDLFLSASLGRPPATSESVSNITWDPMPPLSEDENPGVAGQVFSAMFRICNVFERILVEVYANKAVSLELAKSISQQHRQWTEELPRMLMVDGLEQSDVEQGSVVSPGSFGLPLRHGSSIVTMAYYYSIILLTRPFLTFQVRQSSRTETQFSSSHSTKASLATYANACVNSAIKGIDIAHAYVFELDTPRRQPLIVNSVFISAMCLGLACLDPSSRQKWPADPYLDRAITILSHLGKLNTQSARYAGICKQLKEAATIYATRRDNNLLQENDQIARSIFGDIRDGASKKMDSNETVTRNLESPRSSWHMHTTDEGVEQQITPPPFDFSTLQEEFMLPTSGAMPGQTAHLSDNYDHFDSEAGSAPHSTQVDNSLDSLSGFLLEQGVPLFPLTSYTSPESYFSQNNPR